ncbi:uncharacterized protein [Anolis sagrei]|uniref:uncharacterized protein isoform X2 n=1 Tax=Anolis sagrei TaxID=38937 RepID=UPI00351F88AE
MAALKARCVLVTGSNRGIGLEMVRQLAAKSNGPERIFATCRDPEGPRAQKLKELAAKHKEVEIIQLDASEPSSIKSAAVRVSEQLKGTGLNLLVNNAATLNVNTLETETAEGMAEVYRTNVIGPFVTSQAALNMLTKCQSLGYTDDKILCVALHPGWVQTDMGSAAGRTPLTVDQSVGAILNTLAHLSEKENGTFVNWEGNAVPW